MPCRSAKLTRLLRIAAGDGIDKSAGIPAGRFEQRRRGDAVRAEDAQAKWRFLHPIHCPRATAGGGNTLLGYLFSRTGARRPVAAVPRGRAS